MADIKNISGQSLARVMAHDYPTDPIIKVINDYINYIVDPSMMPKPKAPEAPSAMGKYMRYLDDSKNIDWDKEFEEYRPRRLERLKKSYSGKRFKRRSKKRKKSYKKRSKKCYIRKSYIRRNRSRSGRVKKVRIKSSRVCKKGKKIENKYIICVNNITFTTQSVIPFPPNNY